MCWVQLLTSRIQFLCTSIPETLLHVTLKRRPEAEISADIFARLLRYFSLSYKNLTITISITIFHMKIIWQSYPLTEMFVT